MNVVMTLPPSGFGVDLRTCLTVGNTRYIFEDLFRCARRALRVLTPYVDPTVVSLLAESPAARVDVITTPAPGRPLRPNPVLERCTAQRALEVRYLRERASALAFQAHGTVIIADDRLAYVGSACITDTATHYNLEWGVVIDEPPIIGTLDKAFHLLFHHAAVHASCLSIDSRLGDLQVGSRVRCNGYEGTVTKICTGQLAGMIEVRLPGGVTCVDASTVAILKPS